MEKVTRFGVSIETGLLAEFDRLIEQRGYGNRSEAIRDLIRGRLVEEEWAEEAVEAVGVLALVYDHEARELSERLNAIQHRHIQLVVSALHVHLDAHNCLEVIVMRGRPALMREISDKLLATKNVKHGRLLTTTAGRHLH